MITLEKILDNLNKGLNLHPIDAYTSFMIFADGGDYIPPKFDKNRMTEYIQGVAQIVNSSIVPISGLTVASQTLGVSIVVPIIKGYNKETGEEIIKNKDQISDIKQILTNYLTTPRTESFEDEDGETTYTTSIYGSQPQPQIIDMRNNVGTSIEFSFSVYYTFITNGINSLSDISVEIQTASEPSETWEKIATTNLNISRTPSLDGGAFEGTKGSAKNYPAVSGFEMSFTTPAIKSKVFTEKVVNYILTGEVETFEVQISIATNPNAEPTTKTLMFSSASVSAQGLDNAGINVTLVEALSQEVENAEL